MKMEKKMQFFKVSRIHNWEIMNSRNANRRNEGVRPTKVEITLLQAPEFRDMKREELYELY